MRKFKGLLFSVSMAMALTFSCMAVSAEETDAAAEVVEEVSEEAAGASAEVSEDGISASDRQSLETYASESIQMIADMTDEEMDEILNPSSLLSIPQDSVVSSVESWKNAKEELGALAQIMAHDISVDDESIVITSVCEFENGQSTVTTTLSRNDLTMEGMEFSTGEQSFGEKMQQAVMNTLMGVFVVFAMLLFLTFLIGLFKHVSKLEEGFKKKNAPAPAAKPAPAPAAAPAVEEEVADDGELIAVIAAAIAAAEGSASTDGFVVRSIKRRSNWQRA